MTEKAPCSVMRLVPPSHRVMAERNVLIIDLDILHVALVDEAQLSVLAVAQPIMVATNQVDISALDSDPLRLHCFAIPQGEIPKDVETIPLGHYRIDVVDQALVMFLDRRKWPVAMLNYGLMA